METNNLSTYSAVLLSIGSFMLFHVIRWTVNVVGVPHGVRSQGQAKTWMWVNTVDSLIHSIITGAGSLLCFYLYPQTLEDVVETYTVLAHTLTAFSLGYFIFDFFDMFLNHRKRSTYELMIHHTFVASCFGVSMFSHSYLGFVMIALVIEVNSIFLHWRHLLVLAKYSRKDSLYYKAVSSLNLLTLIVFRIFTLGWMTKWLAFNRDKVALPVYILGCVAMLGIVSLSSTLFLRILKSDYYPSSKPSHLNCNQDINCNKRKEQ